MKIFGKAGLCILLALTLLTAAACGGPPDPSSDAVSATAGTTTADTTAASTAASDTTQKPATGDSDKSTTAPSKTTKAATTTAGTTHQDGHKLTSLPVKDMNKRVFKVGTYTPDGINTIQPDAKWWAQIEKNYNCTIEYETWTDWDAQAMAIMSSKPNFDIMWMSDSHLPGWVKNKMLYNLDSLEHLDPHNRYYFWKNITDTTTYNGRVYGVSAEGPNFREVLMYNKSMLNGSNDLQTLADKGQLTWDKLYEVLMSVKKSGKNALMGQMYNSCLLETFIGANGGTFFTRQDTKLNYTLNSQATRNAITYMQKLYKAGLVLDNTGTYLYPTQAFYKGKVAVLEGDMWNMETVFDKAKFDVGIVLCPIGSDYKGPLDAYVGGQSTYSCWTIPATVSNPDDVGLILMALMKGADDNKLGKNHWEAYWGDKINDKGNMNVLKKYVKALENGTAIVDYRCAVTDHYVDGLFDQQEGATRGDLTAQAYLETVDAIYKAKAEAFNKK